MQVEEHQGVFVDADADPASAQDFCGEDDVLADHAVSPLNRDVPDRPAIGVKFLIVLGVIVWPVPAHEGRHGLIVHQVPLPEGFRQGA